VKRNEVASSTAKEEDLRGRRERRAAVAVRNWQMLDREMTCVLDQLNEPKKRAQFSRDIRRARDRIKSVSPVLAALPDVPRIEIRRPSNKDYTIVKAHEVLDCLLGLVETFVEAFQPKRHRGNPLLPQLIQNLADISKQETGKRDWK